MAGDILNDLFLWTQDRASSDALAHIPITHISFRFPALWCHWRIQPIVLGRGAWSDLTNLTPRSVFLLGFRPPYFENTKNKKSELKKYVMPPTFRLNEYSL